MHWILISISPPNVYVKQIRLVYVLMVGIATYLLLFSSDSYKVFVNPSTTDVVCTTTAEALAMGKIVVCANHPSNDFFKQFPNCRMYDDGNGFVEATRKALAEEPAPLTDAQRHELSWEAATERFLKAADLKIAPAKKSAKPSKKLYMSTSFYLPRNLEDASALMHYMGTGLVSEKPDEEQRKKLGLAMPASQW